MKTRGFTLIELLVVIAIIGLLSSIVLASLNTARSKGGDAAVQSNLNTVRTQAEFNHTGNNGTCYVGADTPPTCRSAANTNTTGNCPLVASNLLCSEPTISKAVLAAKAAGGGLVSLFQSTNATQYAYAVQLKTRKSLAWCVDSSGSSKQEGDASVGAADLTQPTINAFTSTGACSP